MSVISKLSVSRRIAAGMLVLTAAPAAWAVPMTEADSSAFTYKYEMDVDPTTQDLDGDANADWTTAGLGTVTVGGGIISLSGTRLNSQNSSIWQTSGLNAAAEWTLEVRARIADTSAPGTTGRFWGVSTSNAAGTIDHLFEVGEDAVDIPKQIDALVKDSFATDSNSSEFVNFRLARDADGMWVWRNNVLINVDAADAGFDHPAVISRLMIGLYSARLPGPVDIEYVRLTSGSYAPVGQVIPEPASLALIGVGAVLLVRRRR